MGVIQAEARFAEARARAENRLDVMLQLGICPAEKVTPVAHLTVAESIAECRQCQAGQCDVEVEPVPLGYRLTHRPRWPLDPEQD